LQRNSLESNVVHSSAEREAYCHGKSITDSTAHHFLDKNDEDVDTSDAIGCIDDSSHNVDARSDSTSASSTAVSDRESSPDSTAQDTQSPPRQIPLWHDMVLLANSTLISQTGGDSSHGFGYTVLKLMCRASRKAVAIGSIMVIGHEHA
jgi:hypothetical protein